LQSWLFCLDKESRFRRLQKSSPSCKDLGVNAKSKRRTKEGNKWYSAHLHLQIAVRLIIHFRTQRLFNAMQDGKVFWTHILLINKGSIGS
jgi:hypothetical protein